MSYRKGQRWVAERQGVNPPNGRNNLLELELQEVLTDYVKVKTDVVHLFQVSASWMTRLEFEREFVLLEEILDNIPAPTTTNEGGWYNHQTSLEIPD